MFWPKIGGTCILRIESFSLHVNLLSEVALNATCITGQPADQCSDPKAECSSSLRCFCQNGYFENSGHVCTISKCFAA